MDRNDITAVLGLLMLAVGLYLMYAPLALIVPGILLLAAGVAGGRADGRSE